MATANEAWMDALIRHQVGLMRLAPGITGQVNKLLNESEDDIESAIAKRYAKNMSPARLENMLKTIQAARSDSWKKVNKKWKTELEELAQAEPAFLDETLRAVVPTQLEVTLPTVGRLVDLARTTPFEGLVMSDWAHRVERGDIERMEQQIKMGLLQGENVDQIVKRVLGASGSTKITRDNADSITRTAVNAISNAAKQEFYQLNSDILDLEVFLATLDARTTLVCAGNDNKQFPLGQGPIPPLHWRCRSLRLAIINGEVIGERPMKPFTERMLIKEYAEKNNLGKLTLRTQLPKGHKGAFDEYARKRARELTGRVPAKLSYDEWLRRQSSEYQNEVLGPGRAKLFREGMKLDKFTNREGDVLTLDQLRKSDRGHMPGGAPPAPPAPPPAPPAPPAPPTPPPPPTAKEIRDSLPKTDTRWFEMQGLSEESVRKNIDQMTPRMDALRASDPDAADALERYMGSDFKRIRWVQEGLNDDQIMEKLKEDGYGYRDLLDIKKQMPAIRKAAADLPRAQEALLVENPTAQGTLYRGINVPAEVADRFLVDDVIDSYPYSATSTTYDPSRANFFMRGKDQKVLFIHKQVTSGTSTMFQQNATRHEQEVLLGPGKYRIKSRKMNQDGILELELEEDLPTAQARKGQLDALRRKQALLEQEAEVEREFQAEAERLRKEAEEAERRAKEAERLRKEAEERAEKLRRQAEEAQAAAALAKQQQDLSIRPKEPSSFIRSRVEINQSALDQKGIDEVLSVMEEAGWSSLHQGVGGKGKIMLLDDMTRFQKYKTANGLAWRDTGNIAIRTRRAAGSDMTNWTVDSAISGQVQKVAVVAVHEFGHNIHLFAGGWAPKTPKSVMDKIDNRIRATFKSKSKTLTRYADSNHQEYWAESFAKFHHDPDWLLANHPDTYKMVQDVLQMRNMPTHSMRLKDRWSNQKPDKMPKAVVQKDVPQPKPAGLEVPEDVVKDDLQSMFRRYSVKSKSEVYYKLSLIPHKLRTPQQRFDYKRFMSGGDL